ncbi:FecR family protein [Sphingomonas faeni]|uniref:FecR family protein n=1 Tax=Sphingomonas faeni TaxID=185950 RepID=UPI003360B092
MSASEDMRCRDEAVSWFTRLQNRSVTTGELGEFARWRRNHANAAAYQEVERLWADSARLSSDPDILAALTQAQQDDETVRLPSSGVRLAVILAAIAALIMLGFFAIGALLPTPTYRTAVGETSVAKLEDGSRIQLDTDSSLTSDFRKNVRHVSLVRGQAYFDVAHDPQRPFVVDVGQGATVTAVGTSFDVQRLNDRSRVYLASGSVVIRRGAQTLAILKAGERVEFQSVGPASSVDRSVATLTVWRERRLSFDETPLGEAVIDMNRYTKSPIVLNSASGGTALMNGEFSVDDPKGFVGAINTLFGPGTATISSRPN